MCFYNKLKMWLVYYNKKEAKRKSILKYDDMQNMNYSRHNTKRLLFECILKDMTVMFSVAINIYYSEKVKTNSHKEIHLV